MVAPEPARSFIVSEPSVWLDKSTCRVRSPEGWTMFTWKAASGGQLMSQCIQDRCPLKLILPAVTVLTKVISSELFHNTYMTTFISHLFNERGQMSQENIEEASLDYQGQYYWAFHNNTAPNHTFSANPVSSFTHLLPLTRQKDTWIYPGCFVF